MSANSNIFLIGPMGSGKSAVGKKLANDLKLEFHDSDDAIEHWKADGLDLTPILTPAKLPRDDVDVRCTRSQEQKLHMEAHYYIICGESFIN